MLTTETLYGYRENPSAHTQREVGGEGEGGRETSLPPSLPPFPRFSIVRRMHRISVDLSSRSNSLSIIKNCQTHFGRIDASTSGGRRRRRARNPARSSPRVIGSKPREKGEGRGRRRRGGKSVIHDCTIISHCIIIPSILIDFENTIFCATDQNGCCCCCCSPLLSPL